MDAPLRGGYADTDGDGLPDAYEQGDGSLLPGHGILTWESAPQQRARAVATSPPSLVRLWDVTKPLLDATSQERLWLGGFDEETEDDWKWDTGETWGFVAWDGRQPDNANGE